MQIETRPHGCCCENIMQLGCQSVCDKLEFPLQALASGEHILEFDFNGTTMTRKKWFNEDQDIIFDLCGLNEYYTYNAKLIGPDGRRIVLEQGNTSFDCFGFSIKGSYKAPACTEFQNLVTPGAPVALGVDFPVTLDVNCFKCSSDFVVAAVLIKDALGDWVVTTDITAVLDTPVKCHPSEQVQVEMTVNAAAPIGAVDHEIRIVLQSCDVLNIDFTITLT